MELAKKQVLVYGTGKSGMAAGELLSRCGADVFFYDENPADESAITKLLPKARILPAAFDEETLSSIDLAVLSPGVPLSSKKVGELKEAQIPLIGEIELAYALSKGQLLAITGTNGKTTTTTLLGEIMAAAYPGKTYVAGNIGRAYTHCAPETGEDSVTVLEVSSFQLETIGNFHPQVSAILNITEDHLNRHHTMEEYIRVKEEITRNQSAEDVCVLNYEDPALRRFGTERCPAKVLWFSSERELKEGAFVKDGAIYLATQGEARKLLYTAGLRLPGVHNLENIMAAALMAHAAGVADALIAETISGFAPVAHRIEYVEEKNGVIWYNDSKGTNPDAAIRGIQAMTRPTFLIGGGYDKGSDYRPWIRAFEDKVKCLVLEGATRFDIGKAAEAEGFPKEKIILVETMEEAMTYCRDHAEAGDAVLLSPACASWGEFPNYEVRGDVFKEYVRTRI